MYMILVQVLVTYLSRTYSCQIVNFSSESVRSKIRTTTSRSVSSESVGEIPGYCNNNNNEDTESVNVTSLLPTHCSGIVIMYTCVCV